ncbi:hypothetical protein NX059_008336 [Plenodomus lindquistii]|nr:hypothetical protein NX059_008336 [Plenodomus lindquistii]
MSSQQQQKQNNNGSRPTGATGGGHSRNTCRNYQQPGHPPQYIVQTTRPAEAESISHANKQLHSDLTYLPMYPGVPDLDLLVLEEAFLALHGASYCGVFNLE